jgi:hypothetical protein
VSEAEFPKTRRAKTKAPTFPVVTSRVERPFSMPDAMKMLREGYTVSHVSKVTGYPQRLLEMRWRRYAA